MTEVNEESERVGLKVNIQKTKITASSPITSWKIDGETMETVRDYSLGFNITADGEYSQHGTRIYRVFKAGMRLECFRETKKSVWLKPILLRKEWCK